MMLKTPPNTPPEYRQEVILLDGSQVVIRPITSADKQALLAFHKKLSSETRYLRFHYPKCELTEKDLACYCDLDYWDNLGLIAEKYRDGKPEIAGVGRYSRLPNGCSAEVAFVVEDKEQGKGLGTHLLNELAKLAWERGIANFIAELTSDNVKMMSIFRKYDSRLCQEVDGSSRVVTFTV